MLLVAACRRAKSLRRSELQEFFHNSTFGNIRYRYRIALALQDGTINPMLEAKIWDAGYPEAFREKRGVMLELDDQHPGILMMLLRKPLTEDPLAEAKPVAATVIEREPLSLPAGQVSIVPPSRPRKVRGSGPPLKPTEGVME